MAVVFVSNAVPRRSSIHFRLPNKGVEASHECYESPRVDRPNPGNWGVGVVRGYDGEGHHIKED